jgi:hypothetical protein
MPIAKISDLNEYLFDLSDYGGIYSGVPTLTLSNKQSPKHRIENPKSPIFQLFPFLSIFAGLRSL